MSSKIELLKKQSEQESLKFKIISAQSNYLIGGLSVCALPLLIIGVLYDNSPILLTGMTLTVLTILAFFNAQEKRNTILNRIATLEDEILKIKISEIS